MRNIPANNPAFLWRGMFILLPLLLLAGVGLYSLRQDRLLAEAEARERCGASTRAGAAFLVRELFDSTPTADADMAAIDVNTRGELAAIAGSTNQAQTADAAEPHPLPLARLSIEQLRTWQAAQDAQYQQTNSPAAAARWREFIALHPSPPFLTQARYNLALLVTNPPESIRLFSLVEEDREGETEGGLPLYLLAELQHLKLQPSLGAATLLCSNAVNFPSFATPMILDRVGELFPVQSWREQWRRDEAARELFAAVKSKLPENGSTFWARCRGGLWLIRQGKASSNGWRKLTPISMKHVDAISRALAPQPPLPPYVFIHLEIAGRTIFGAPTNLPKLAESKAGDVILAAYLANPHLLYAQQRWRTFWFAAIIVISALAAAVGLVSAYRGFQEQVRLNEMKTNFVSSVSHELRAPIASMRLLSEGLDRGKITDPSKQKEYFRLLSQESRRLSTLIENILDFSRIDQGRKTYEKEPTDLAALVKQTVAMMTPAAAERRVTLAPPVAAGDDMTAICDGLAIQQALINLLDNAVKHSPPDTTVTVGLESAGRQVSLWVEDCGPGIPVEERARIFERFYRRGTELRRETQGIGIGLTIVKHVVEAHDGRVMVSGQVGKGSRFTIELPRDAAAAIE